MAQGILDTSKLFFNNQSQLKAFCLQVNDNPEEFVNVLKEGIKEVDTGDGVIVFCDMLYGSPCNSMFQILAVRENSNVQVSELIEAGHQGITNLKEVLKSNM